MLPGYILMRVSLEMSINACNVHWRGVDWILFNISPLTLPIICCLLPSKAQGRQDFLKPSEPCHVGIHWKALHEYSQRSTHVPEFSHFSLFLHHFVLAKLATRSIRVKGLSRKKPLGINMNFTLFRKGF